MIEKENIADNIIEFIVNLFFPNICGICGKICDKALCRKCEINLEKFKNVEIEIIQGKNFKELISLFNYQGEVRSNILNYKFKEKSYMAKTFTKFLINDKKLFEKIKTYDTIVPVPISKERMKERGYNQSLIIAKELNKYLKLEIAENSLIKIRNVIEQSKLNKEERQNNIIDAYEIKNEPILENKKILLIDDIYTTGSTVNECSRMLKLANPKEIGVLALAKVTND